VRGKKPNRTRFLYSAKVTKYCRYIVLFGSKVPHYSTKGLCHNEYKSFTLNPKPKTLIPKP